MRLSAGELNRRIAFEEKSTTYDENRSRVETWSTFSAFVPAKVVPVSGTDGVLVGEQAAQTRAEFWIRFREDIKTEHRINYNGRIFDILDIAEIDRRHGLKIAAIERRAS
ncbi:MAG: phage head closure protein [Candidatus Melainabacteria bacterium]|nr:phage head closure protein [Candidatus Melainabacteria bacterium]